MACWGAVLFASAGRIDWLRGWISIALYFAGVLAAFVVIRIANPVRFKAARLGVGTRFTWRSGRAYPAPLNTLR